MLRRLKNRIFENGRLVILVIATTLIVASLIMTNRMASALRKGIASFDRKMRGYVTPDAIVVGVESRTSTPVRIPRDGETLMHPEMQGLFPAGEGAGYAGGIISAALDGTRVAEKIAESVK